MEVDSALVRRLVADQFPQWAHLPVRPVAHQGNDNRTFRLGDELAVRLPSAEGYAAGIAKEDRVLPVLARHLPVPVPRPVASGVPGAGYPWPWSVRRWIDGAAPEADATLDRLTFAHGVGVFLRDLRAVPTSSGPPAGRHSFSRGCHPSVYSHEVDAALRTLGGRVDAATCRRVWADALSSHWPQAPTWFHGDLATGNLLVRGGRLAAVIDFGTCGVGDPACDLVLAWTFFRGEERAAFADAAQLDADTWCRARGWALWKALVTVADPRLSSATALQRATLDEVLAPS